MLTTVNPASGLQNFVPSTVFTLRESEPDAIYQIVNLAVSRLDVLEVMNMTTKIHIDTISVQQRLQTFTHIGTFTFLFRRIGIDRMMADYDLPFLSRRGKRFSIH